MHLYPLVGVLVCGLVGCTIAAPVGDNSLVKRLMAMLADDSQQSEVPQPLHKRQKMTNSHSASGRAGGGSPVSGLQKRGPSSLPSAGLTAGRALGEAQELRELLTRMLEQQQSLQRRQSAAYSACDDWYNYDTTTASYLDVPSYSYTYNGCYFIDIHGPVEIHFSNFYLEDSSGCYADSVSVYSGWTSDSDWNYWFDTSSGWDTWSDDTTDWWTWGQDDTDWDWTNWNGEYTNWNHWTDNYNNWHTWNSYDTYGWSDDGYVTDWNTWGDDWQYWTGYSGNDYWSGTFCGDQAPSTMTVLGPVFVHFRSDSSWYDGYHWSMSWNRPADTWYHRK